MMNQTEVLRRGEPQFAWGGKFLGYATHTTDETIKPGLAARITRHAITRLTSAGFDVRAWHCTVSALMDDGDRPAKWVYSARFVNAKGGALTVQGIMVDRYGWPCLDHGFGIEDKP